MSIHDTSAWFHWDPSRNLFVIPYFERAVAWYGFFFALGFIVGYFAVLRIFSRELNSKEKSVELADSLLWYVVIGCIVGARLGHVLFYDWPQFQNDLFSIFRVWEGGLASHGGAVGVLLGLLIFRLRWRKSSPSITFAVLCDSLAIPTAFVAGCIRIGNFFNQEILGTVTSVPWAIVFGHPADGSSPLPRHPVQLYESVFNFAVFALLFYCWKNNKVQVGKWIYSGLFLSLIFSFRIVIEVFKLPESMLLSGDSSLLMGQYLSIPFAFAGYALLIRARMENA
ncbi:MAG: phosphatidylglycerol:prolipoprotein diacylglycerol transferase [Chlamydiales bacterium]|jgi:phosphatidylglycerol:prolipoprotein diacylglycerol transferase